MPGIWELWLNFCRFITPLGSWSMSSITLSQSEMSTGRTMSVVRLKHSIPSSGPGTTATLGRTGLTVDGEVRRGSERDEEEGRADGIAKNEKSRIDAKAIGSACIIM